jgi:DNA-binding HxlR family transcriptional regulator
MEPTQRSGCPINLSLEVIGDKWSLLVIRDMMFGNRRHFRELLNGSQEGIATNILADRLGRLVDVGLLTRAPDPSHKQKVLYSLTEPAIQLVPVMAALGTWGRHHLPVSHELSVRAELLERGGPELWDRFMDELRELHLGIARPAGTPSVLAELQAVYDAAMTSEATAG